MDDYRIPSGPASDAIVQYWNTKAIPGYVEARLAAFRELNPDLRHLLFDEASAAAFIAERYGERELAAFRACAVPAMQADYLRYCAIHALGGIYSDVGFRCVAPLRPLIETSPGGTLFERRPGRVVNGLFAFRSSGHPLLRLALELATANIERRLNGHVNLVTGPVIFTSLVRLRRAGSWEALRAEVAGHRWKALAEPYSQTIGDYARVIEAFDGVRVRPLSESRAWVDEVPLPYRGTDRHWPNHGSSIYRSDGSPPAGGSATSSR